MSRAEHDVFYSITNDYSLSCFPFSKVAQLLSLILHSGYVNVKQKGCDKRKKQLHFAMGGLLELVSCVVSLISEGLILSGKHWQIYLMFWNYSRVKLLQSVLSLEFPLRSGIRSQYICSGPVILIL